MAQLIVRNLEEDVKQRLLRRAKRHGQSMEEEVRSILRNAVSSEDSMGPGLGSRWRARFAEVGLDGDIAEVRGTKARPVRFTR